MILGLDLSTNVGFVLMQPRSYKPHTFGTFVLPYGSGSDRLGPRFYAFDAWLYEMFDEHRFDAIAWEAPVTVGRRQRYQTFETELLVGLAAIVRVFAMKHKLPHRAVPWQQVKITVTGTSKASKDDMVVAAMRTWDWQVSNEHEADAGGVAVWALEQLGG